ncbi:major facilitator superfamily metabolite/H(+) symporter [Burkholderia dolosa]|nr:major facilitator superfamily metabolite/H(+) symporter [Burkholderia dolosa]
MFAEHGCIADAVPVATFPDLDNLPIGGALSDRIGRKAILVAITVLAICTSYPALSWLSSAPSFARMLIVLLWLSFFFGMYNGAMVVALTEVMPAEVRVAGFSLAFSLATAVFRSGTATFRKTHAVGDACARTSEGACRCDRAARAGNRRGGMTSDAAFTARGSRCRPTSLPPLDRAAYAVRRRARLSAWRCSCTPAPATDSASRASRGTS